MSAGTKFYRFECFDLLWEFDPIFLQIFRSTDGVPVNLEALVRGPLCRNCQFSLVEPLRESFLMRISRETLTGECGLLNILTNPCPRCGHKVQISAGNESLPVRLLKERAYLEAQRLARCGKFPGVTPTMGRGDLVGNSSTGFSNDGIRRSYPKAEIRDHPEDSAMSNPSGSRYGLNGPFPETLSEVREEMDYWASRQNEGYPGSDWEEGIKNRLAQLERLERRLTETARIGKSGIETDPGSEVASRPKPPHWKFRSVVLLLLVGCILIAVPLRNCLKPKPSEAPPASALPKPVSPKAVSHYERNSDKDRAVVFVHGIFGNGSETWMCERSGTYWPKLVLDDDAFQSSDVYVVAYDSPYWGNRMTIDEVVSSLNNRLESDKIFAHREVVFVCHSLGGLIIQRLLLTHRNLAKRVLFIFFFSTPESGSQLAQLAHFFSADPLLAAMLPGDQNAYLLNLEYEWIAASFEIKRFCAYEKLPTKGVLIVDRLSGTRNCSETPIPINEDHVGIVKPCSRQDDSYISLRNAMLRFTVLQPKPLAEVKNPSRPPIVKLLKPALTESQVHDLEALAKELSLLLADPTQYPKRDSRMTEYLLPADGAVATAYYVVREKLGGDFGVSRLPQGVRTMIESFLNQVGRYLVIARRFDDTTRELTERALSHIAPANRYDPYHEMCAVRAKWVLLGYDRKSIDTDLNRLYNIDSAGQDKTVADSVAKDETIIEQAAQVKRAASQLSLKDVQVVYDAVVKCLAR